MCIRDSIITIDGGSGKVMLGTVPTVKPEISGYFSILIILFVNQNIRLGCKNIFASVLKKDFC